VTPVDLLDAEQAPIVARPLYAGGDPGPIVGALAHVPELLEAALPFIGQALAPGAVDARTKEIAILRTSALLGCRYCTDTHSVVARDAGLALAEVRALRGEAPRDVFADPREQALLDWVDAVALGPGAPSEAVTLALRAQFAAYEIVDLTLTVGATLMLNRFATALALPTGADTLRRLAEEGLT
jgi:AhpD family alkylhydroperoxidase